MEFNSGFKGLKLNSNTYGFIQICPPWRWASEGRSMQQFAYSNVIAVLLQCVHLLVTLWQVNPGYTATIKKNCRCYRSPSAAASIGLPPHDLQLKAKLKWVASYYWESWTVEWGSTECGHGQLAGDNGDNCAHSTHCTARLSAVGIGPSTFCITYTSKARPVRQEAPRTLSFSTRSNGVKLEGVVLRSGIDS